MRRFDRYDEWMYPYFVDPFGMHDVERRAALERLLSLRERRIGILATACPEIAPAVRQCLDSSAPLIPAIERIERW